MTVHLYQKDVHRFVLTNLRIHCVESDQNDLDCEGFPLPMFSKGLQPSNIGKEVIEAPVDGLGT
jgi:hypothetical protein